MSSKARHLEAGGRLVTAITKLHDLATAASRTRSNEATVEVRDVERINLASALTKKAPRYA